MNHHPVLAALSVVGAALLITHSGAAQTSPSDRYRDEIVAAVQRDLGALRPCYEAEHTAAEAAWRRLRSASVVVNADGSVGAVTLTPGPGVASLEACMRPIVARWRLTAPAGGAAVTLTYSRAQIHRAARGVRA